MGKLGKPVTQRQLRVGEMIKQALSMIFLKDKKFKEGDYILIKCDGKLVSIANLQKGYIIPRRNFNN